MWAVRTVDTKNREDQCSGTRYAVELTRGGKPVPGIESDRISGIEERVMEWDSATHIHGWFVDNVQNGKDDFRKHTVSIQDLRQLLETCEKVLNGSQLVLEKPYKADDWYLDHERMHAEGKPSRVIKNLSVAYRLLPTKGGYKDTSARYDEAYLKDVEATRDWAERMLRDIERGLSCTIHYHSSSW